MNRDPHFTAPVLTAEEAAIGAALWSSTERAAKIVRLLTDDDISSPAVQLVRGLIAELCAAGITPEPSAVFSHALTTERVTGPTQTRELTWTLLRLFDHRATVPASGLFYVSQALEQAWRRRAWQMGTRLAQVADHADPDELDRLRAAEQAAVDAIRARHLAALNERTPAAA